MKRQGVNVYDQNGRKFWFCSGCGKEHEMGVYVMAHQHVLLVHTCDQCQAKHETKGGKVWRA